MRPKIIFAILLMAVGLLAIVVALSKIPFAQKVAVQLTNAAPVAVVRPVETVSSTNVTPKPLTLQQTNHEEFVRQRAEALMDLSRKKDSTAHQEIINELRDSTDPDIRQAALDALEQANDRSVIPQMQEVANQTDDAAEKKDIQDAIDFIKLPSLTEYMKAHKGAKVAPANQSATTRPANNTSANPQQ